MREWPNDAGARCDVRRKIEQELAEIFVFDVDDDDSALEDALQRKRITEPKTSSWGPEDGSLRLGRDEDRAVIGRTLCSWGNEVEFQSFSGEFGHQSLSPRIVPDCRDQQRTYPEAGQRDRDVGSRATAGLGARSDDRADSWSGESVENEKFVPG
jgi:hypothetical protein